jgi:octaprenyl-diphosphate synthase
MVDDLLDYTANAGELGKTPGADIREGKLTLPLIVALENADPADHLFMEKMIKNPEFTPEEFQELKNKLYRYNGIQYTKDLAIEYVNKAKECLDSFEDSSSRQILTVLADYTVVRNV